MALALEGIGRKRNAASHGIAVKSRPIDFDAREPKLARRGEKFDCLGFRSGSRAGMNRGLSGLLGGILPRERGQRLARADFEQRELRLLQQRAHRIGEAHGVPQLRGPVAGRGPFLVGGEAAVQAGDDRDLRLVPRDARDLRLKFGEDRVHHGGVKRVRGLQLAADDALVRQLFAQRGHDFVRAGDDAELRPVDRREAQVRR